MNANTTQAGGFVGDPGEALNPPASAGGCCGSPATTAMAEPAQASTCCGTATEATAEGSGGSAKEQPVASGAGCCG